MEMRKMRTERWPEVLNDGGKAIIADGNRAATRLQRIWGNAVVSFISFEKRIV
jgi:hypothetical protein